MLNKRIKSLLVAGLLVFSMAGGVFAEGSDLPKEATAKIENPDFGDFMYKTYELQDKFIVLKLTRHSSGGDSYDDYQAHLTWDAEKYEVTHIKMVYEDESFTERDIMIKAAEGKDCYVAVLGEDGKYRVSPIGDDVSGKKLIRVEVTFKNLTKGNNPVVPPVVPPTEEPEEDVYDPETGDASIMPIVATAILSAAGLYVVCKKDDEE
jgi:hypothetical protein